MLDEQVRGSDLFPVWSPEAMRRVLAAGATALAALSAGHVSAVSVDASGTAIVDLYGWRSGFAKARTGPIEDRHSITVGLLPYWPADESADWLEPVLDSWNEAAGWQLFVQVYDDREADVTFQTNAAEACPLYGGCVGWDQFPTGWYEHCYVSLWPWVTPVRIVTHELGHCLGFEDVTGTLGTDYRGIMSYARNPLTTPVNDQDIASLAAAGYRP